jgi:hypothetical protein
MVVNLASVSFVLWSNQRVLAGAIDARPVSLVQLFSEFPRAAKAGAVKAGLCDKHDDCMTNQSDVKAPVNHAYRLAIYSLKSTPLCAHGHQVLTSSHLVLLPQSFRTTSNTSTHVASANP